MYKEIERVNLYVIKLDFKIKIVFKLILLRNFTGYVKSNKKSKFFLLKMF